MSFFQFIKNKTGSSSSFKEDNKFLSCTPVFPAISQFAGSNNSSDWR
jgi:hypothetical protein